MTRFEDERLTSWYKGPCLVEALDVLRVPKRTFVKPLRITINDIYSKGSSSLIGDCILGKIESGVLNGQKDLVLMPHNEPIAIRGIMKDDDDVQVALAGQIVEIGIKLEPTFEKSFLKRGNVICCPEYPVPMIISFVSRIVVYDLPHGQLCKGEQVVLHSYTSKAPARITKLLAIVNQSTGDVIKARPRWLHKG